MNETCPTPPLKVDIVSDVVCPWCIIGYLQLQRALSLAAGDFDLSIQWHPFELNPDMPSAGQDLRQHLAMKYGTTPQQSQAARERLRQLGDSLGFRFVYRDDMRMVNTFRAHQLLHWAREQGRQTELKLRLFKAFFTDGEDVNDPEVLARLAGQAGLPAVQARDVLESGQYAESVRAAQRQWREREIYAVPAFIFDGKFMVPGAQEAETFLQVMRKIREQAA